MLGLSRVVRDEAEGKLFGKEDLPCFAKQMNGLGNTLLILASYSAFGTGRICTKKTKGKYLFTRYLPFI